MGRRPWTLGIARFVKLEGGGTFRWDSLEGLVSLDDVVLPTMIQLAVMSESRLLRLVARGGVLV